jgi:hypothetical protein
MYFGFSQLVVNSQGMIERILIGYLLLAAHKEIGFNQGFRTKFETINLRWIYISSTVTQNKPFSYRSDLHPGHSIHTTVCVLISSLQLINQQQLGMDRSIDPGFQT